MNMNKLLVPVILLLCVGCTTQTFMKKAVVGHVDNQKGYTVLFRNSDGTYRPQFSTDCPQRVSKSGSCVIAENRITDIEPFYKHQAK